jgi:excisionase family DNA binding protein
MVGMIGTTTEVMKNKATTSKAASGAKSEILTAEEVGLRLRLPLSTVYYLAKTGALPGFQLGRSWRFSSSELDRLTQSKPAKPRILAADAEKESLCSGKNCPAESDTDGNNCSAKESLQSLEPIADIDR